ncbi:glycosyltransferase family 2 protein [Paenibacillus sp. S-38]|uniref:glycosyltransferase family 2 protein n=1 Tax=Paenibacillus sp. S-38 TaxID=3416710 RepID=UPI003CE67E58
MLLLILEQPENAASRLTLQSVPAAASFDIRVIRPPFAERMNALLQDYRLPFFAAAEAGVRLNPLYWLQEAGKWDLLPIGTAGIVEHRDGFRGSRGRPDPYPFLWSTEAVRETGGFETWARLPFDSLVLESKYRSLARTRPWAKSGDVAPFAGMARSSRLLRDTRELVVPLLEGTGQGRAEGAKAGAGEFAENAEAGDMPLCSVVLCLYRDEVLVPWAVRSVLAQTHPDWELILVDDGSPLPPEQYMADLLVSPKVRILRHDRNYGKARALNTALAHVRGRWIVELDADDWLAPGCVAGLSRAEDRVATHAALLYGDHYEWLQLPGREPLLKGIRRYGPALEVEDYVRRGQPVAPRIYRTAALRELGGWPEGGLFGGRLYEDMEMLLALAETHSFHYVPEPLYHRRIRKDSVTRQRETEYQRWLEARPGGGRGKS